jgi:hypothetical protein
VAALISYLAGSHLTGNGGEYPAHSFAIFLIGYLGFAMTQNLILIAGLSVFCGLYQKSVGKAFASNFVPEYPRVGSRTVNRDPSHSRLSTPISPP